MEKKSRKKQKCFALHVLTALAVIADTENKGNGLGVQAAQTIAELYGDQATPKNCFEVVEAIGSRLNGQKVSDWNQLQDISVLSFEHSITSFKRCYPYRSENNTLTSLALTL